MLLVFEEFSCCVQKMKQNMSTPALNSVNKQTKSKDVALDAFNGWTRNCLMTMKIEKTVDRE